jgi:uncharacterized membrane protein YagU involved in acid resistance
MSTVRNDLVVDEERDDHVIGRALGGGIIAGLIAGIVLEVAMAAMASRSGHDVWEGMKMAGYPFLGERATQPGPDDFAVEVGVASHLMISVVWGALFGMLVYGARRSLTLLEGALFGVVVWLGMYHLILPVFHVPMDHPQPLVMQIANHVVFGLLLAVAFLPFQHHIPRRARLAAP